MATTKERHTPGPWVALALELDKDGMHVAIYSDKQEVVVCTSQHYFSGEKELGMMEVLANAALISTAPEMHAMLNKVLNRFGEQMTPKMLTDIKLLLRRGGTHRML